MNHADLVAAVTAHVGASRSLSKADVAAVLASLTEVSTDELAAGNEVTLNGLGKLSVKGRAAREGRNPATGETIQIEAKKVPHFSATKALKDAVAG
jgi:DNA-binding protein HU-beta